MQERVLQTCKLDSSVSEVRFANGKRLDGLLELGISTIRDLLEHFPFRYDDFSKLTKAIDLKIGEKSAVLGLIHEAKGRKLAKGAYIYEITVTDETGMLKAVWFNQRWLAEQLVVGKRVLLLGKPEHYAGFVQMSSPLYTLIAEESPEKASKQNQDMLFEQIDEGVSPVGIVPVYHASKKVSSNWIKRLVLESRELVSEPIDPLPARIRMKRRLVSRQIAFYGIHSPVHADALKDARNRLAYEQVFWQQLLCATAELRLQEGRTPFAHESTGNLTGKLAEILPFELTPSQKQAVSEIHEDMCSERKMNRLLLGDVGSGKTVVATYALAFSAQSGYQSVIMAPTEVLVQQYAAAIGPLLDKLSLNWAVLSASCSPSEKESIREGLRSGEIHAVFGTHALIEPKVVFKNLSLIVVDEQHRFGVEQRAMLIKKSPAADFLSLTATPIPRTLALTQYGAIEVSYLENRPGKAQTTTTYIEEAVSYRAYEAIREALKRGEQAYIVCPLIAAPKEDDDDEYGPHYLDELDTFEDTPSIAAAEVELEHLRQAVLPEYRIELLTSKVKSEDKQRIMREFKEGAINVLVSTTVIEVGIDVPNATVMLILDADRFGLAQLHQLRGRVGRGTAQSQVFLVARKPSETAERRLRLVQKLSDGLKLAEADLLERREGDLTGTRQHGVSSLSLINVIRDKKLIEAAHKDVRQLLEVDSELKKPEHAQLSHELELRRSKGR